MPCQGVADPANVIAGLSSQSVTRQSDSSPISEMSVRALPCIEEVNIHKTVYRNTDVSLKYILHCCHEEGDKCMPSPTSLQRSDSAPPTMGTMRISILKVCQGSVVPKVRKVKDSDKDLLSLLFMVCLDAHGQFSFQRHGKEAHIVDNPYQCFVLIAVGTIRLS